MEARNDGRACRARRRSRVFRSKMLRCAIRARLQLARRLIRMPCVCSERVIRPLPPDLSHFFAGGPTCLFQALRAGVAAVQGRHHDEARCVRVPRAPSAVPGGLRSCRRSGCCLVLTPRAAASGAAGNKFKMSLGLPVGAVMNCADNTGAKNLYIISVKRASCCRRRSAAAAAPDAPPPAPPRAARLGRPAEPPAGRVAGRHVHGHGQEGQAGLAQEGCAAARAPPA